MSLNVFGADTSTVIETLWFEEKIKTKKSSLRYYITFYKMLSVCRQNDNT